LDVVEDRDRQLFIPIDFFSFLFAGSFLIVRVRFIIDMLYQIVRNLCHSIEVYKPTSKSSIVSWDKNNRSKEQFQVPLHDNIVIR